MVFVCNWNNRANVLTIVTRKERNTLSRLADGLPSVQSEQRAFIADAVVRTDGSRLEVNASRSNSAFGAHFRESRNVRAPGNARHVPAYPLAVCSPASVRRENVVGPVPDENDYYYPLGVTTVTCNRRSELPPFWPLPGGYDINNNNNGA